MCAVNDCKPKGFQLDLHVVLITETVAPHVLGLTIHDLFRHGVNVSLQWHLRGGSFGWSAVGDNGFAVVTVEFSSR